MKWILTCLVALGVQNAFATTTNGDYLVKYDGSSMAMKYNLLSALPAGSRVEPLALPNWGRVQIPASALRSFTAVRLQALPGVAYVQPNYKISLYEQPGLAELKARLSTLEDNCPIPGMCDGGGGGGAAKDNPEIPAPKNPGSGDDPEFKSQWGMIDIGTQKAWGKTKGRNNVVVAVIDTGVDYTHEDLLENLWRNAGEMGTDAQGRDKSKNGVDDDNNGYIDDTIGWDFVTNDNKPFDLTVGLMDLLTGGGNPGHGTHCAGNVAARGFNGKGVAGVAPHVSIMSIRFLGEKGGGTTAGAVQSIMYAVKNGAQITSNSWGSEGEEPGDPDNQALKDAIRFAEEKGVLFIAAAGNGRQSNPTAPPSGYDNDTDAKPGIPASYPDDIIISVAALDSNNNLGVFSNYGKRTVDIGAPGVKVFSTMVGNKYSDTVIDLFGTMKVTWDGTSMATPHVAGAAALYLSQRPNATWKEIKEAIIKSAVPVAAISNKVVSGGKLNVESLMNQ